MEVFEAISDPVRREILVDLAGSELSAGEIAGRFTISRPAVSRHLRVLREAGLVRDDVNGRRRIYRLRPDGLEPLRAWLPSWPGATADLWSARFDALETEVRRTRRTDPVATSAARSSSRAQSPPQTTDEGDRMSPTPTGEVRRTGEGRDLVLVRDLPGSIVDVWASLTESERTGRWFASWTGDGRSVARSSSPWSPRRAARPSDASIQACEPPTRLAVRTEEESGTWELEVTLEALGADRTRLTFVHHLGASDQAEQIGPGWEYYLDRLEAARADGSMPDFADYWPSMGPYYVAQDRG